MANVFRNFGFGRNTSREQQLFGAGVLAAIAKAYLGADNPAAQYASDVAAGGSMQLAQEKQLAAEEERFRRIYGNPSYNIFGPGGRFGNRDIGFPRSPNVPGRPVPLPGLGTIPSTPDYHIPTEGLQPIMDFSGLGGPRATGSREAESLYGRVPIEQLDEERGFLRSMAGLTPAAGGRFPTMGPTLGDSQITLGLSPEQVAEVNRITSFERKNKADLIQQREANEAAMQRTLEVIKGRKEELEAEGTYEQSIADIKTKGAIEQARIEAEQRLEEDRSKMRDSLRKELVDAMDTYTKNLSEIDPVTAKNNLLAKLRVLETASAGDEIIAAQIRAAKITYGLSAEGFQGTLSKDANGNLVFGPGGDLQTGVALPSNGEYNNGTAPPPPASKKTRQKEALEFYGQAARVAAPHLVPFGQIPRFNTEDETPADVRLNVLEEIAAIDEEIRALKATIEAPAVNVKTNKPAVSINKSDAARIQSIIAKLEARRKELRSNVNASYNKD